MATTSILALVLYLTLAAMLIVAPRLFLRNFRRRKLRIFRYMLPRRHRLRKLLFTLVLLYLLMVHLNFQLSFPLEAGSLVSTILLIVICTFRRFEKMMFWMNSSLQHLGAVFSVVIILMWLPFFFMMSLSLATLLMIACVYPREDEIRADRTRLPRFGAVDCRLASTDFVLDRLMDNDDAE